MRLFNEIETNSARDSSSCNNWFSPLSVMLGHSLNGRICLKYDQTNIIWKMEGMHMVELQNSPKDSSVSVPKAHICAIN